MENVIMDNDEFFMEASKNPDIKARKRTVNNLRRLGVDRAHEVDNKKLIDKYKREYDDLDKKFDADNLTDEEFDRYYWLSDKLNEINLHRGVPIKITDSYGNKHNVSLKSNNDEPDSYDSLNETINITPKTMASNKFNAIFNHEAGHHEQNKRIGFNNIKSRDYNISDKDDYPTKCAKLFLQNNKNKMNSHDNMWVELHADFLSCKKSGFGKMIKTVYSFKKSKKKIDTDIENCIKNIEEERVKISNRYLKYTDKDGNEHVATEKDAKECIELCKQTTEKLDNYYNILQKRYDALFDRSLDWNLSESYNNKLDKVYYKVREKKNEILDKLYDIRDNFKHNGISAQNAARYFDSLNTNIKSYEDELKDLKATFTTYDYRIKFLEDMYWIHEGHPGRCSMKYPPMTPEDKKYMQEFTVEEMYLSNIITESEYIQLQERIQILTERSE